MISQIIVVQDNQDLYVTRRLQYITIKALYANTIPGSCSGALNQTPDHLTTRPTCMNIQKKGIIQIQCVRENLLPPVVSRDPPDTRPRFHPHLLEAIIVRIHRPPSAPAPMMAVTVATPRKQRVRARALPAMAPAP